MATEADIPTPICEIRGKQGGNQVDQATNISISKLPQEEKIQAVTYDELSTVEGENFLRTPSVGEVHCEVNKNSPDVNKVTEKLGQVIDETEILPLGKTNLKDQPVEIAVNEETSSEEIQQNAEESNGLDKDDDRGMVPVQCSTDSPVMTSEMKAEDTLDHSDLDDVRVETEQTKDITSDHRGTNDSFTEQIALSEETLQVTNLPSEETKESKATSILQGEELNVQVETTAEKAGDGKTTEEDISCNLRSDVSKEECDQNKMTSEQEALGNKRNFEHDLDTAAEKGSHENSTFTETITEETSNSEEFQSKNDLSSSFHKEEDIAIQKDDRPVTTPEDTGIIIENTLNESNGDVEYQSKTLEDNATNHSDPDLTEKSEESSFIQVDGSQKEHDGQLEVESAKLPLTEVPTRGTNDKVSAAIEKVEDEDEGLDKAKLIEKEQHTSASLKEDMQIEESVESLHVALENIEVSTLGQENNTKSCPEDQSTNTNLYENTGGNTEEKPIDAGDIQKEILESFSTIASSSPEEGSTNAVLLEVSSDHKDEKIIDAADTQKEVLEKFSTVSNQDVEGNSMIKLDGSETKNDEHLGKESEKPSLPLPLAREASDNDESIFLHEARIEDEPSKAEFYENERSTESMVLKIESKIEKSEDSLHVISEDIKAPDLSQEIETRSSIDRQSVTTHPHGILDEKTEDEIVDAAETKEETLEVQDVPPIVPNEKTEENSLIQVDDPEMENEEHLYKDTEQPSLVEDFMGNIVMDEVKIEDEIPSRAELLEEGNTESALLKEEMQMEKPLETLHAALEGIKASDLGGQHTETIGFLEEQRLTENRQGIQGDITEEKTIDAANISEETQEFQNVSNEDNDEDSFTHVDASKIEQDTYLEEEMERPSLTKASVEDSNGDESTILVEPKIGNECPKEVELFDSEKNIDSTLLKKEDLQDAPDDHKASTSSEDIETTCSPEEESLVMRGNTIDVIDTEEVTLEVQSVAKKIPYEHVEENSVAQVDCSQMEHEEHLEKNSENSSLTEAPTVETSPDKSKDIHEPENSGNDLIKVEVENEKYTESIYVKEEAQVEKPFDSLQPTPEDIQASDPSQETNSSIKEQITIADPQDISSDKTQKEYIDALDRNEESLENIATNIPNEDHADNSPIEGDGSQKPSLKEAITGNINDEELTVTHEAKLVGESEKNTECTLVKKEVYVESLQVAAHDFKASALGQDRETTLEEQSLTTNPQEIMDDTNKDKINDATGAEEGTPEDKQDIAKTTPYEDIEENFLVQVDCSRLEQTEDLENDNENISSIEAPIGDTESTLVKEEMQEDKPLDSLQVAIEDVKASVSCQETSSIVEKTLTADPQEISCDKTEENIVDATYTKNENLEDVATNVSNGNDEDKSPIEVDGSQKPSLEDATIRNNNNESTVTHEAELVGENEKNTEYTLAKDEVHIESLQVATHDIKAYALGQARETSVPEKQSLTTNPQGIMDDIKDDKTSDATSAEEETPEDKDIAKTTPYEDIEENLFVQVDCSRLEQNEDLKNDSENKPLTEAPIGDTIESTLVNEEAQVEKHIDSLQVTTTSSQGTSSIEEKIPTVDPQEISCDKTEEKTINAAYTKKENLEDVSTNVPNGNDEDNSPIEIVGSEKPSVEEALAGNTNDDKSTTIHDAESADENIVKVDLLRNEENIECALVNEEVSVESLQVVNEDIKATASSQDRETSHLEKQDLSTNPQGIMGDHKEDKTIDEIGLKEETLEDKSYASTSYDDTKENSLIQVDCSQLEQNEHSEKNNESICLTEPPTADTTENTLIEEEAQVEDHIEPLQVATEDTKAFAPCQDTETSSTEEQILTVDPEDISRDKTIEKSADVTDEEKTLEVQDISKNVPHGENEDNSPTGEDGLEKPSLKEASTKDANDHESTIMQEAEFVDESLIKDDLFEQEKNTEGTLVKEDVSIESSRVAVDDIKASNSSEDRETNSQEKQILSANLEGLMGEDKENKTIDPTDLQKRTPKDEVTKEIANVDNEATNIELKEEEGYLKDLQMTTAINIAAPEEKNSNSAAEKIPCTKDLDVNEDVVGHLAEDPNDKQEESSITKVSKEHTMTSNENVPDVTSLASEASEQKNDHKVVEEASSCGDRIDTEKIGVLDDGSITIPTNETRAETDPRGSTEAEVQVPNGEKEAELVQQDLETETDQQDIEEELLINASQVVSESKGVNGEEERTDSDNCKEISGSSNSVELEEVSSSNVALEEDSTSHSFQKSKRETREETENREAQKQEELHVSALVQESSMEKIEKDVQLCVASANDSDITQEMHKLEEAALPAPDENIIETTECKESEVEENATKNKEQDDTIKSFLDDKEATEREQEKTESTQEKVTLDEKVETTKSTPVPVANDILPVSPSEISKVDHSITGKDVTTDKEELRTGKKATDDNEETKIDKDRDDGEPREQKISDASPAAPIMIGARNQEVATLMYEATEEDFTGNYMTEANDSYKTIDTTEGTVINESTNLEGILVNSTDLESKIDDEAPEIIEPTPTATEGQDVESTSVEETSTYIGGMTEEKSDSNEVAFAPGEPKSGYEPKNQVLESVAQVQTFDIISETEETKIEEENLEAAAEIKSEKIEAEDIFEQKETTYEKDIIKDNISSEKIKEEDEDIEDCHQGSREEDVITDSHLEEEAKQEEEINTEEMFEVIKNENETEKVSKISKEADDKAPEDPEENLLASESIDRSLHQKEQVKSVEEVATILHTEEYHGLDIAYVKTGTQDSNKEINSSTVAFPEKEDNRTGAGDTDNEMAKDEGLINQNSKIPAIDAAARELPKGLNEYIICEAPPTNTVHQTTEDSEAKKENANTIMMQQQEEDSTSKHEILPLPELAQGKESEKQNQKDEICSSDEVQAKDEENLKLSAGNSEEENKADTWRDPNEEDKETCVEAEKLDFPSHTKDISEVSISDGVQDIPEDNENSISKNKSSAEEYPNKSTESQISTVSNDVELTEQASEATRITAEMQEPKAGIDSRAAVPNATGVESRQVEEVNDKCKVMAETSTPEEPHMISTSKIILECTVGGSMEVKDHQTKLHDLPQELNISDTEVSFAEKADPEILQDARDISEDVQGLNEGSSEVSNKENPVEAVPEEIIKTSEGQETEGIQNAPVPATLKQETEEQELRRASESVSEPGVNCEEEKTINDKSDQLENSWSADTERVSESNIHPSSMDDTAQNDKNEGSQRQIDSLSILQHAKCPDSETSEKDLPVHFTRLDGANVTELEVTPLSSKDKHVVLEADHSKNLNPENLNGNENISAECSQGEREILKPSKVEQEETDCGNGERTEQETGEKLESKEPSLSGLLEVSMRENSQMANQSVTEKEPTTHREDLQAEQTDEAEHEDAKTDEEKDNEEGSSEQKRSELSSEAPVIVDMGDADVKVSHKKSHNILSGVGSKVKHSIAKVKKAITGKSSHPKASSPKKVIT